MSNKNQPLKPLPHSPAKKQLYKMYWKTPERQVKLAVHEIVKANRPYLTPYRAVRVKTIFLKEFQELIDIMGAPPGYEKFFRE